MVLVAIVPGPAHAKKVDGYLKPFLEEIKRYGPDQKGFICTDHSKTNDDQLYQWFFQILILNVLGDYPGIAQLKFAADHKSLAGCIKCKTTLSTIIHRNHRGHFVSHGT